MNIIYVWRQHVTHNEKIDTPTLVKIGRFYYSILYTVNAQEHSHLQISIFLQSGSLYHKLRMKHIRIAVLILSIATAIYAFPSGDNGGGFRQV
jgi:hypothetical protein